MKPFILSFALTLLITSVNLSAQCIADVYYLEDSPVPCNFVGMVDLDKNECFDFTASPAWTYTWRIWDADDGGVIATYDGFTFNHIFEKFGGYTFCVEIEKDGTSPGPEHIECITYTTCELCGDATIEFEYENCPVGKGCNLNFAASIDALNMVGLKSTTRYVFSYIPTGPEQMAGAQTYDIEEIPVDLSYVPGSEIIDFSEDINFNFARGCYQARIEFELDEAYAPHAIKGGPLCDRFTLFDDQTFQCIACNDTENGCQASEYATTISNEEGVCLPLACPFFKSSEFDAGYMNTQKLKPTVYPNPAAEFVQVSLNNWAHDYITIQLLDTRGVQVLSSELDPTASHSIDLSLIHPGIYVLVLQTRDEMVHREKLIIR